MGRILERTLLQGERMAGTWALKDELEHKFSPELWVFCSVALLDILVRVSVK